MGVKKVLNNITIPALLVASLCGAAYADNNASLAVENIKILNRLHDLAAPDNRAAEELKIAYGPLLYRVAAVEGAAFRALNTPLILRLNDGDGLNRILGGIPVSAGEFPWQVALLHPSTGALFCGGSHIGGGWIVTAAHCISDKYNSPLKRDDILVLLGTNDLTTKGLRARLIADPLIHPKWNPFSTNGDDHQNDIALLKIDAQEMLPAISLPLDAVETPLVSEGSELIVSGWGHTTERGTISTILLKVGIPVVSNQLCARSYNNSITSSQICAGAEGRDSCQGDSGGPLHGVGNGGRLLIGVVSYGKGCGRDGYPGVYTRIAKFKNWIAESMTP